MMNRSPCAQGAADIVAHVSSNQRSYDNIAEARPQLPSDFTFKTPVHDSAREIRLLDYEIPITAFNISDQNNEIYFNEFNLYAAATNTAATWESGAMAGYGLASGVNVNTSSSQEPVKTYADMLRGVIPPGNYSLDEYAVALEYAMNNAQTLATWAGNTGLDADESYMRTAPRNTYRVEVSPIDQRINISVQTFTGTRGTDLQIATNPNVWSSTSVPASPFPFAVRPGSLHTDVVKVYSAVQNPYGVDPGTAPSGAQYTVATTDIRNWVQDSPIRIILNLSNNHRFCPGDHVGFRGTVDGGAYAPSDAFVIFVNGTEVHLLVSTVQTAKKTITDASIALSGDALASGSSLQRSVPLGIDPMLYRAGFLVAFQDNKAGVPTLQRFVYANAATDYMAFQDTGATPTSSPFNGNLEVIQSESQMNYNFMTKTFERRVYKSTEAVLYVVQTPQHHMLAKQSLVVFNLPGETYNAVSTFVSKISQVYEMDQTSSNIPRLGFHPNNMFHYPTSTYSEAAPATTNAFETNYIAAVSDAGRLVIGAATVRGTGTLQIDSGPRRMAFISLEHPTAGLLGSVHTGSGGGRPYFARVQLSGEANQIRYLTADRALGLHVFRVPTRVDRLRVRLVSEDEEDLPINGVPWSMALSII